MEEKSERREDQIKMDAGREFPEEVMCPSCGKFVGAYEKCPYCGTELKKRISIVFFKRSAIVVALGGLFLLWLTATHLKPTLIKINEITPFYNNAVVEVEGKVISTKMKKKDDISFLLDDGTAELKCQAFRGREKMKSTGNLPHAGDTVSVIGQINITDKWGTSMMINVPSNVKVTPVKAEKVKIGEITVEDKNKLVEVVGEVVYVRDSRGNKFISIGDITGRIDMPLWKSDIKRIRDKKKVEEVSTKGNELRVIGSIDEYRGNPQIQVRDIEEIEVLKEDTIPTRKIPNYKGARRKMEKVLSEMPPALKKAETEADEKPITTY